MTDELGAISVGLRVGLGTLDRDLATIKKKIDPLEREHVIPFKVGRINVTEVQREIDKITRGNTKIHVSVGLPANAGRLLHRELSAQLKAAGPVTVQVKANLSRTEIMRIKREIEVAMRRTGGPVVIPVTGVGRGGGGTPPAAGGPQPATPPPTPPRSPAGARSAPVPPSAASAPTATPQRASRGRTAREAHDATAGRTRSSGPTVTTTAEDTREFSPLPRDAEPERPAPTPRSRRPRAAAAAPPPPNFGGVPTGPASSVAYRTKADGTIETVNPGRPGNRAAGYLKRRAERSASRTVSTDTLRRDKVHVNAPETEEEIEYASRPTAVSLPLDEQARHEAERRSRGVRGARRSGARERNEPVLTPLDMISRDIQHDDAEAQNSASRDAAVRAPSRRSAAWYGSRGGVSPAMGRIMSGLQFYKFDPVLAQSFKALEDGELGEARELLRGFSGKLAGADPRKRKKFFKLFRDTESVPPELLEKHAALQALFAEIGQQEAALRVANTEEAVKAFPKPKGPQSGWTDEQREGWADVLGQKKAALKAQADLLRGLRRRAGGGRVGRDVGMDIVGDLLNERRRQKMADAVHYDTPGLTKQEKAFRLREIGKLGDRRTSIEADPGRLWDVVQKDQPFSGMAYDPLFSPESKTGGEEHNPFADTLGGMFGPMRPFLPKRAGGGRVEGPLTRRLRIAQAAKDAYAVGDGNKAETYISDSGRVEIVGKDGPEIRTFPEDGKILPYVPEWVRRMDKNAKDFTGRRAAGGPVEGGGFLSFMHRGLGITSQFNPPPPPPPPPVYRRPPPTEYEGRLMAEPGSGLRGRKVYREGFEGERKAIAEGKLSPSGGVQRVFVVNMPAGGGFGGFVSAPGGALRAAGPTTRDPMATMAEDLRKLLRETKPVTPKDSTPETVKPTALTAEEKIDAKLEAVFGEDPRALRERLVGIKSGLSETQAYAPVRSLAPSIGQLGGTLLGRGELLKRLATARDLTAQATKAEGIYNAEREKSIKIQTQIDQTDDPEAKQKLVDLLTEQSVATEKARNTASGLADEAMNAAKSADALSLKIGTLIGNTAGIIGGTLLFGATLGVAQAGLTAIQQIMAPVIERATGFRNVTAEITKGLGEQTRAQQGAVQTTVAQREAQAGLSEEISRTISPLLQQRAIIEGGNTAFKDQLDLIRAARTVEREETVTAAGGQAGPFQPFAGVPGITRATGGLFGSPIGATPSLFEQISQEAGETPVQQFIRGFLGEKDASSVGAGGVLSPEEINQIVAEELENQSKGRGFDVGRVSNAAGPALAVSDSLEAMRTGLDKVGSDFEIIGRSSSKWNEQIQRSSNFQLALNGVSQDLINSFDKLGGFAVINRDTGEAISGREEFKQAFEDVLRSATIPDPEVLIKQLTERIIPAARDLFSAQGKFQRQTLNPAQFALQSIATPTPGIGDVPFEAGLVGKDSLTGKIDTAAAAAAKNYKAQVGGAVDFVNSQIEAGREQLINLVPANLKSEFTALLGDIEQTGKQISNIQLGIQQQQVNLQVAEYNNQLRIARRSLQDAKDLQAGIGGEARNTLGGLEGQNIALQRQLQLLQFELQQRQINFRLATAGFVAPGTTPEERAARIEFAKKEAEFAQKQLDIQKQLANNQFKGIQITADRSVTDLLAQISLLEQGKQVTVNTAAASRALDVLNKKQQLLLQQAGSYIEEGVKITQAAMEAASEIQKQTGKGFAFLLSKTAEAWGIFGEQAQLILNALTNTGPTDRGSAGRGQGGEWANGIVGDTLGPTQITVGEAAGEKVAVLKNPKLMPSSVLNTASAGGGFGGGGGSLVQMTVVISGNSVREDTDLATLAELVAQKVEDRLMQKTSLFGLRRA